jgi:CheY-like chemotaxis protein
MQRASVTQPTEWIRYQSLIDESTRNGHPFASSLKVDEQGLDTLHITMGDAVPANRSAPGPENRIMSSRSLVAVVDDNESVRESLPDLLRQSGFDVEAFASAEEFLQSEALTATSCLILDVGLPGMSGPDLQQELSRRGHQIPVVFITAQGDRSLRPRLLARGAVACLFKPFSDTALLEAVEAALRMR